ncbi:M20/M25/M40 family metallo-hydrolase [Belliella kenyensis]|uniref:M20/M25/M40 family metallo-hydrolase n=1 Tax=Belliella kenyensis TaxID=1472724 RepID=A0ABV8EP82_9BACT|nr:M20/M25/M40 family metallo-hydrolase [Belliella kenyensis]MCH7402805.1 M20/M25/M40 family metallo-hydrolase [Belliella kenyensis]MDN3602511.1 M20/M25/M40 family metallo-hydrolase [Belliella kenyensis]
MKFLEDILAINSVSGDELSVSQFILNIISERKSNWKVTPNVFFGENFHNCILLKFGNPRTAVFAHMDTIGFMTRYENQLITVGGPELIDGTFLVGNDSLGPVRCKLIVDDDHIYHDFPRAIDRGTYLSFEQNIRIDNQFIQGAYLDNRLGLYNAIEICQTLEDGWVVFTTYEEHGGGSMPFLLDFIMKEGPVKQALISDITWVTSGVVHNGGVAISIRDKFIPRRTFINKVIALAKKSGIDYQLEVEDAGGSDGREIQFSRHLIDWCFVGAPEDNVHSPNEKVALHDLECMIEMYQYLMAHL